MAYLLYLLRSSKLLHRWLLTTALTSIFNCFLVLLREKMMARWWHHEKTIWMWQQQGCYRRTFRLLCTLPQHFWYVLACLNKILIPCLISIPSVLYLIFQCFTVAEKRTCGSVTQCFCVSLGSHTLSVMPVMLSVLCVAVELCCIILKDVRNIL